MNDKETSKQYKDATKQFQESVNGGRFIFMISVEQLDNGKVAIHEHQYC